MQTRLFSLIEVITSMTIGVAVSFLITVYILPVWGLYPSLRDAVGMTTLYTSVSMVRAYVIRRIFNWLGDKGSKHVL